MESTDNKILTSIKKCGRGKVYYASQFARFGTPGRVQKAMEQLVARGELIRVARGIYCYPKIDKVYGLGAIAPAIEEIAIAIAQKDKSMLAPTGEYAQFVLGLTQQMPMNVVYLTDGVSRKLTLEGGMTVQFRRSSPKAFKFRNKTAMLVNNALRSIGKKNVTEEQLTRITTILQEQNPLSVLQDLDNMPAWIRLIVKKAYEKVPQSQQNGSA